MSNNIKIESQLLDLKVKYDLTDYKKKLVKELNKMIKMPAKKRNKIIPKVQR